MYQGVKYIFIYTENSTGVTRADDFFDAVVSQRLTDSIVNISYVPFNLFSSQDSEEPVIRTLSDTYYQFLRRPTTVDGYTPRNKKLLTYPYICMGIDCLSDSKTYRYEWFGNNISFLLKSSLNSAPEIACAPVDYNGIVYGVTGQTDNATEQIVMRNFPQCAFTIDSYRAWVANKSASTVIGLLGSASSVGIGLATGNASSVASGITSAMQQATSAYLEATQGNKTKGTQGGNVDAATKRMDFYFKQMGITRNYAEIIDDFFDRFGYSCRRVKLPNTNVRPHWTYTKTKDCTIRGGVPVDDMHKICSIYDNGITFWRNGDEVGNYSYDNSPIVEGGGT